MLKSVICDKTRKSSFWPKKKMPKFIQDRTLKLNAILELLKSSFYFEILRVSKNKTHSDTTLPTTHPSDRIHFISARFYKDSTTFCKDSVRIPKCYARIPEESARNSHDFLIFAKFLQRFHNILQGFQKILQGIHMIPWYLQTFSLESEYKDSSRFHGIPQDDKGFLKILQ